ncbi:serine hydrolase domain-containing protein [Actinoplanes palleronii]|uniref:Beta-lactamase-related domain-containing protein n=1 Tax=Actinoplanes palleronii TaxID=113570 RepID=A0ABQ4BN49_9ACTN|nr:serine hydrolase domain-containing protein [Actinoplanes palleronii]GIE72106.1 hypothetical protein Apa02nite_082140 [Actinoplanes palleronii]
MVRTEILVRQGSDVVVDETTRERYQLASVSKQFTAAAVLLLVEQGVLGLDDPVGRWISGCPGEWRGITLRQLLRHTSGLGHWEDYPMIDLAVWVPPEELLTTFHAVPLKFAPGGGWSYSSAGYVLLAHVVERAADTPYRKFLGDRIFGPLGLSRTFAGMPGDEPDVASGHDVAGQPVPSWELDVVGMGAGDVWSTAEDVLTWLDSELFGRLCLDPAPTGKGAEQSGYGYGVFTGETAGGRRWWHHSGDNAGFKAFAAVVPSVERRFVVLTNSDVLDMATIRSIAERGD